MNQKAQPVIIIAIAVVVLGILGFLFYKTFVDDGHGTITAEDMAKHRGAQGAAQGPAYQSSGQTNSQRRPGGYGNAPGAGYGGYGGRR